MTSRSTATPSVVLQVFEGGQ
ncbi:hypothetical protein RB2654_14940 [Rhodobacterales bacterium HTCC2654]|uniref:Uncharacterized protein n=1 Tax=Maritimibacter alkaliphilus HTCC2654 TaxID=314271 RepID=A3VH37_9RHOB|nr:hypothetical protein RB2654_14940 [Rhodobacterales bacterium HTCC2654] [Maritimibacter alkaliphilus HTCC2654]